MAIHEYAAGVWKGSTKENQEKKTNVCNGDEDREDHWCDPVCVARTKRSPRETEQADRFKRCSYMRSTNRDQQRSCVKKDRRERSSSGSG